MPTSGLLACAPLDRIQRSVGHLEALIHDLLDLARIEAGRFAVQRQAESLDEMVSEALIVLRPLAEGKGLVLHEEAAVGVTVLADRERIFQVFSNLVGNAIKFTPAGGRIVLRATVEQRHAVVAVIDTGPGLTPEQMSVFNRYWQASKAAREGAGLGLYIAKGIVEAHGGRIWVEDAHEGGAAFNSRCRWPVLLRPHDQPVPRAVAAFASTLAACSPPADVR